MKHGFFFPIKLITFPFNESNQERAALDLLTAGLEKLLQRGGGETRRLVDHVPNGKPMGFPPFFVCLPQGSNKLINLELLRGYL